MHPSCQTLGPKSMKETAAPSHAPRVSVRISSLGGSQAVLPRVDCKLRAARPSAVNAPPALCRERTIPSRSSSVPLVTQNIQNRAVIHRRRFMQERVLSLVPCELSRLGTRCCPSTSSVRQLVSKRVAAQRSWWRQPRPNPAIEGMPKRLRLLVTPHIQR